MLMWCSICGDDKVTLRPPRTVCNKSCPFQHQWKNFPSYLTLFDPVPLETSTLPAPLKNIFQSHRTPMQFILQHTSSHLVSKQRFHPSPIKKYIHPPRPILFSFSAHSFPQKNFFLTYMNRIFPSPASGEYLTQLKKFFHTTWLQKSFLAHSTTLFDFSPRPVQ